MHVLNTGKNMPPALQMLVRKRLGINLKFDLPGVLLAFFAVSVKLGFKQFVYSTIYQKWRAGRLVNFESLGEPKTARATNKVFYSAAAELVHL